MPSANPVARYLDWLHLRWPAGTVEKLPEVRPDGSTAVPGLYVVGDLTGVPLLKFAVGHRRTRGTDDRGRSGLPEPRRGRRAPSTS